MPWQISASCFAATVGEDDVKLFKYHVKCDEPRKWTGTVVEIHVPAHNNFKWNHSNLENSMRLGYKAAKQAIGAFKKAEDEIKANKDGKLPKPLFINENPQDDPEWLYLRDHTYADLKKAATASGAKPK